MPHAVAILAPGAPRGPVVDTLILDSEQRRTAHGAARGIKGTPVSWDFHTPVALHTDDVLALEDGTAVEVVAAVEPLFEVRSDMPALARIAWMLGDRHVAVQVLPNRIRLRADAALAPLIAASGAKVVRIDAPFEPEGGAYAAAAAGHDRAHGHGHIGAHDHSHDHADDHHDHHHRHRTGKDDRG